MLDDKLDEDSLCIIYEVTLLKDWSSDTWTDMDLVRGRIDLIWGLVFVSEDFNQCSYEIDVVGSIIVGIPYFTPDCTVWVLMSYWCWLSDVKAS